MNRGLLKTAAFLLIIALVSALPFGSVLGDGSVRRIVLRLGDTGEDVVQLQRDLRALSLLDFTGEPSGVFDEAVEHAVMELQRVLELTPDGIYGAITHSGFKSAVESGLLTPVYIEEMPLYGRTVGLDAGHQGEADLTLEPIAPGSANNRFSMTAGCFGIKTNVRESVINLSITLMLSKLLKDHGAVVVTSRESEDVFISNAKRAELMNEQSVDFWLRIHCDHSSDSTVYGSRVLLPNSITNYNISVSSAHLGRCIIDSFCEAVDTVALMSRSLTTETGFNWSSVPVAAIELGYLSNAATDLALSDSEYQKLCAQGLLYGIAEYYFEIDAIDEASYLLIVGGDDSEPEVDAETMPRINDASFVRIPELCFEK